MCALNGALRWLRPGDISKGSSRYIKIITLIHQVVINKRKSWLTVRRLPTLFYASDCWYIRAEKWLAALHALGGLNDLGRRRLQLRTEHTVPETASNTKTVLIVGEMVLQVVLLELLVIWG